MLIRTVVTTLPILQVSEFTLKLYVIERNINDPDNIFNGELRYYPIHA